jgi:hypothetical protein
MGDAVLGGGGEGGGTGGGEGERSGGLAKMRQHVNPVIAADARRYPGRYATYLLPPRAWTLDGGLRNLA